MHLDSSNPKEAEKYIKAMTGKAPDVTNDAKGQKTVFIDHKVAANAMIKYINAIPDMPKICKTIMTMKLINPGMTNWQIALGMGMLIGEVNELETIGKEITKKYLEVYPVQEGIDKFNRSEFGRTDVEKLRLPESNNPNVPNNNANPSDIDQII